MINRGYWEITDILSENRKRGWDTVFSTDSVQPMSKTFPLIFSSLFKQITDPALCSFFDVWNILYFQSFRYFITQCGRFKNRIQWLLTHWKRMPLIFDQRKEVLISILLVLRRMDIKNSLGPGLTTTSLSSTRVQNWIVAPEWNSSSVLKKTLSMHGHHSSDKNAFQIC